MTKKGKDTYEDFYERAFTDINIDEIYKEGGSLTIQNFMKASKDNILDEGYHKALYFHARKGKKAGWTLGGILWEKYFKDGKITQNKINRIIVRAGNKIQFNNKTYKGGMFLPRAYIEKKR